jgi:UDP-N-acetylmuramoylalanine--D-glutamate ligase
VDKMTSPTEIFCNNYSWKIIGITGTKWKSTTSTILNLALQNAGFKTKLVWNIWTPVLDEINILDTKVESWELKENNTFDYIIYEMSSYMLDSIKPEIYIGYINNIYDCHLDWHCWRENYQDAKLNILKYAKHKIANNELNNNQLIQNNNLQNITFFWGSSKIEYKDNFFWIDWIKVLEDKDILLNWPHNRTNICGVLAILKEISKDWVELLKLTNWLKTTLSSFSGLPYRIQNIWVYKWMTFINDAMATTPNSTMAAINTFWNKIWTLFLWWQNSGFQFDELAETIRKYKIPNLVILPENIWENIFPEINVLDFWTPQILDLWNGYKPKIFKTDDLKSWVKFAFDNSKTWQVVLLSTWAPFLKIDWVWNPYTTKWDLFTKYVQEFWSLA